MNLMYSAHPFLGDGQNPKISFIRTFNDESRMIYLYLTKDIYESVAQLLVTEPPSSQITLRHPVLTGESKELTITKDENEVSLLFRNIGWESSSVFGRTAADIVRVIDGIENIRLQSISCKVPYTYFKVCIEKVLANVEDVNIYSSNVMDKMKYPQPELDRFKRDLDF